MADRPDEQALVRLARLKCGPRAATAQDGGEGIDAQLAFLHLRSVALETTVGQHRANAGFEELACGFLGPALLGEREGGRSEQANGEGESVHEESLQRWRDR